jgi:hypothetical protein
MTFHSSGAALLVAASIAACSPGPAPISRSMRDPSNPSAPEGLALASTNMSSPAPVATPREPGEMHEHGGHHHMHHGTMTAPSDAVSADAGTASVVYVCPMHPEVTSSTPGRCPKCGMTLVPKK